MLLRLAIWETVMVASIVRRVLGISVLFIVICLFTLSPHTELPSDAQQMDMSAAQLVLVVTAVLWLFGSIFFGVGLLSGKPLKKFSLSLLVLQVLFFAFVAAMGNGQIRPADPEDLKWATAFLGIVPVAALVDLLIPPWRFDNILES